jgi:hypothetical protein
MIPFKINLGSSTVLQFLIGLLWLVYVAIYWRALVIIIRSTRFTTEDKILWFLVITMAPIIGLITFHAMCPPRIRDVPVDYKGSTDS